MMPVQVIDNFLPDEYIDELYSSITSANFCGWSFCNRVSCNDEDIEFDNYYFIHPVYENLAPKSILFDKLQGIFYNLNVVSLIRARFLMYPYVGKFVSHNPHIDFPYSHKAAVLYLHTNNGFTEFSDGTKVESVRNRVVIFDGSTGHNSTTCTDNQARVVFSVNYFN